MGVRDRQIKKNIYVKWQTFINVPWYFRFLRYIHGYMTLISPLITVSAAVLRAMKISQLCLCIVKIPPFLKTCSHFPPEKMKARARASRVKERDIYRKSENEIDTERTKIE